MTVHMSASKYRFHVTNQPEVDAKAAYAARGAHDDWTINAQARVAPARMKGEKVWTLKLSDAHTRLSVYLTHQQASALGLCHCGRAAEYVGFEGLRCGQHAKYGMSTLCTNDGCTNVSHTGFSHLCNACITPTQRAAYEARQAKLRAQATRPYRY